MTKLSKEALSFFAKHGSTGGKKAAENLTKEQRRARALKAVRAREAKKKKE